MTDRRLAGEVLLLFGAATLLISVLYRLRGIPWVDQYISVGAAVVFLYLPAALLWRRGEELDRYGFTLARPGRSLLLFAAAVLLIFPPFIGGYLIYVKHVCPHLPRWLAVCAAGAPPALRLPPEPLTAALGQVLVVAMPEEFFFRGYMQGRLAERYPPRVVVPLVALIFALGHVLVSFEPGTLMVFFPGLVFGLLRHLTGSILAGALFHACCNLLIDILHRSVG
jgi:hypothetical protein